jgi:hypothetical protein
MNAIDIAIDGWIKSVFVACIGAPQAINGWTKDTFLLLDGALGVAYMNVTVISINKLIYG